MPTPLREAALAAIAAQLVAQIANTPVDRARPAPVDIDKEKLPRLVLVGTDWAADETAEPLAVHYTLGFAVSGYVRDRTHLAAEQAMAELHASVVAALSGWTPATAGMGEPAQEGADFRVYDAEESAKPAAEFTARFSMLCLGPLIA